MAKLATDKLLHRKSKEQYCKEYDLFVRWVEEKYVTIVLANILLCLIIGSLIGIFIFYNR